jgi:hypothetical protein
MQANDIVKLNVRDLAALFNGAFRALAKAGLFRATVMAIVDAIDLETTAQYERCGHVRRMQKIADKDGYVHAIEGTVYGWKLIALIDVRTRSPLAVIVDDRMRATMGEGLTSGCWVHAMRHRQGKIGYTEQPETSAVGIIGLTVCKV